VCTVLVNPFHVLVKASILNRFWRNLLGNSSRSADSVDEAVKQKLEEETNEFDEKFPDKTEFIQKLGSCLKKTAVKNMADTKNGSLSFVSLMPV